MAETVKNDLKAIIGEADVGDMSLVYYKDGEDALRELAGTKRYTRTVEIGTYNAVSACILADYSDLVETFDFATAPKTARVLEYAKQTGRNICAHVFPNDAECFEAYRAACKGADLVFVDAGHLFHFPARDIEAAIGCPRIICHDATESFPAVLSAVLDAAEKHGYIVRFLREFAVMDKVER